MLHPSRLRDRIETLSPQSPVSSRPSRRAGFASWESTLPAPVRRPGGRPPESRGRVVDNRVPSGAPPLRNLPSRGRVVPPRVLSSVGSPGSGPRPGRFTERPRMKVTGDATERPKTKVTGNAQTRATPRPSTNHQRPPHSRHRVWLADRRVEARRAGTEPGTRTPS